MSAPSFFFMARPSAEYSKQTNTAPAPAAPAPAPGEEKPAQPAPAPARTKLCVRGLSSGTRPPDLEALFGQHGECTVVQRGKVAFVEFCRAGDAGRALVLLDGAELQRRSLRVSWSVPKTDTAREADRKWAQVNRSSQRVKIRSTGPTAAEARREETSVTKSGGAPKDADYAAVGELVEYVRDGLRVGQKLYSFPQPKYMLQLVHLCGSMLGRVRTAEGSGSGGTSGVDRHQLAMMDMLTRSRSHQSKELSESLGMVAAVRRAIAAAPGLGSFADLAKARVNVFVPGDGCRPYTAAAMCLLSSPTWRAWSIDPAMKEDCCDPDRFGQRLKCFRALSQDFPMPTAEDQPEGTPTLTIVLAVHSHCPLSEFLSRAPRPRLCISLPCCGRCGIVETAGPPILTYEDPDITSPVRKLIVHYEPELEPEAVPGPAQSTKSAPLLKSWVHAGGCTDPACGDPACQPDDPSAATRPAEQQQLCKFWTQGRCTKGDGCVFRHGFATAQEEQATAVRLEHAAGARAALKVADRGADTHADGDVAAHAARHVEFARWIIDTFGDTPALLGGDGVVVRTQAISTTTHSPID